jgi:hypothetical protein
MCPVSLRRTFGEQNVAGSNWILGREDCSAGLEAVEKRLGSAAARIRTSVVQFVF